MATISATDARLELDRLADIPNVGDSRFLFVGGKGVWDMASHALARAGRRPCPCCGGRPLYRRAYCLGCDRFGLDGTGLALPGLKPDEARDPTWRAIGTIYNPRPGLAGGVEKRRPRRPSKRKAAG